MLLLGSDNDAKFGGTVLTQSMILARVNPTTRQVVMESIPRDLWVPLARRAAAPRSTPPTRTAARARAVATVEEDFDIHIDHYAWIGLLGLVNLINEVGGIDVVATNPVMDDFYPADLSGKNPYAYRAGRGASRTAAHERHRRRSMYVRSRHGDLRSDFGRSQRQQQVLLALRAKAKLLGIADLPGHRHRDGERLLDRHEHQPDRVAAADREQRAAPERATGDPRVPVHDRTSRSTIRTRWRRTGTSSCPRRTSTSRPCEVAHAMRRAITVVTLLALMAGFGFGVNRLIASRKTKIPTETTVYIPTATRPAIVLPGTLYLAQNGDLYTPERRVLHRACISPRSTGTWMQPAYVPGTQNLVAVLRSAEYSNLYLLSSQGTVIRQLSNNATTHQVTRYGSTTGCSGRASARPATPVLQL